MDKTYPTFDICNLITNKLSNDLFNADRFHGYLLNNPPIKKVHKHSFYHLVYFTSGKGQHIIDFKSYPIEAGSIYFMRPGQVHRWEFESDVDGYVINFSATFFDQLGINSSMIDHFPFFNIFSSGQMLKLSESNRVNIVSIFEDILRELCENHHLAPTIIAADLLRLFVLSSREMDAEMPIFAKTNYNSLLFKQFLDLIEENFKELRLPKDYAALLYITSNHLNFICKDQINMSSGEIIRNRILLEAKRMLVNVELSVAAIAIDLNFFDTSYFIKFFKKYTQFTPEAFRKQYYNKS
ncbi:helix-turn-helix domain-containing protein [Sphingobacterium zeae]|uniref:AraC family transcriptional activator of pobA n=1 Tax=Sphingobacterium zeae TaxID=1776859 RepID=A0ABU0U771_9SPHI|nr:AraC family transcriptional regulator [Sphingobacterium zeae]MDQ1150784.1 AraC family transcriptional activator of pobA [Sphingobacterium zeae]